MSQLNKNRPGYKNTKVGWIPSDWEVYQVRNVYDICNNLRLPISEEERKSMPGEYPYFGPTGVLDHIDHFRIEGKFALIGEDGDHFLKFRGRAMTLLIDGKFNVNNHAHLVRGLYQCTTEWFFWFFHHRDITAFLTRQGAGRYKLNKDQLGKLHLAAPPLPEQEKIAEILSAWEWHIEQTGKLIDAKQRLKKGLMQQLLTGRIRFPEFGRPVARTGELPDGWKRSQIKSYFKIVNRKNGKGCKRVLTASGQYGLVDQSDFFNRSVAGQDLNDYYLLKRGEFAYNRSAMIGYPYGAIKRLDRYDEGVLSTLYICFLIYNQDGDADFFTHYFESGLLNRELRAVAQVGGRAHGLLNITLHDFTTAHMQIPVGEEQRRIAVVFTAIDGEVDLLKQKRAALQQQKKGLMQKLLTGEVRVKV